MTKEIHKKVIWHQLEESFDITCYKSKRTNKIIHEISIKSMIKVMLAEKTNLTEKRKGKQFNIENILGIYQ